MSDYSASLYPSPPLYLGQSEGGVRNPPNTVVINGRTYAISLENYSNTALPAFRQGVVTSGEPSDQLFNPDGGWWRYRFDWSSGAGQNVADFGDEQNGQRFKSSENVYVWDENKLSLSHNVTELFDSGGTHTAAVKVYTFNDLMYILTGDKLYVSTDGSTTALLTTFSGTVHSLAFDGTDIYGISNTDLYVINASTGVVSSTNGLSISNSFDHIGYVGNLLVLGAGNELYHVTQSNHADFIFRHYDTEFEWTTFIGAGSQVFVGGYGGLSSQLYTLEPAAGQAYGDVNHTPVVGGEATTFTGNERLFGGFEYGSIAVLQTSKGIRVGTISNDQVTYGPVVPSENPVFASVGEGQYVWYGATRDDEQIEIMRVDLDNFTEVLKPAYANEVLQADTAGKAVMSLVRFAGILQTSLAVGQYPQYGPTHTFFSTLEGKVFKIDSGYQQTGTLSTGDIYFGTAEYKTLGRIQIGFEPLNQTSNETVQLEIYNKEDGTKLADMLAIQEGQTFLELPATGYTFSSLELVFTLTSDGTTTPIVKQWKVNAFPVVPPVQRWRIPIMLYNTVVFGDGQGQHLSMNPHDELEYIRDLWINRKVFVYREGIHEYRVRLDTFTVQPTRWDEFGEWLEAIVFVEMLSV
jgi:hypothetical protein